MTDVQPNHDPFKTVVTQKRTREDRQSKEKNEKRTKIKNMGKDGKMTEDFTRKGVKNNLH